MNIQFTEGNIICQLNSGISVVAILSHKQIKIIKDCNILDTREYDDTYTLQEFSELIKSLNNKL